MDNVARFYRARCEKAEALALAGHDKQALDICWDLRLRPDLPFARRACVNLLIASIVTENVAVYANECLHWCQVVRDLQLASPETLDEELSGIEEIARDLIREQGGSAERIGPKQTGADAEKEQRHEGSPQSLISGSEVDRSAALVQKYTARVREDASQIAAETVKAREEAAKSPEGALGNGRD